MKKILVVLILVLLYNTGCKKDFDPVFYGTLNPTVFPSTEEDFEKYALDAYLPFTLRWGYEDGGWKTSFFGPEEGITQLFDAPTDIMAVFPWWGNGAVFFESKSRGDFTPLVAQDKSRSHFEKVRMVTRMTKIIDDIENTDRITDETVKSGLIAEVKMARGWTMLFLLQLYGPVPVIMDASKVSDMDATDDLTRPERTDFASWIEADLSYAADNLPLVAKDYGRFNKGIALVTLMRLYMNEKDFANAVSTGREIQGLGYGLVSDYTSLFTEATEKNNETIWAISCDNSSQGVGTDYNFNPFRQYVYPADYPGFPGWGQVFAATWEFYHSFDPNDKRRSLIEASYEAPWGIVDESQASWWNPIMAKYPPTNTAGAYEGNDFVVARYADVILMLAEAINETSGQTGEAIGLVNQVRARAGIADLPAADYASKEAFNDAILRERGWELYFEGQRLPDLVRHGKWPTALDGIAGKQPGPPTYPLPNYIVAKGCAQNSGY